ncbi:mammalian cell entry protein [Nocardia sp. 852002-51101_SCH5132738]|nr:MULTISPECIES: MCE family protein [unclassified Nocardia]MBF6278137.1 MCE family protein [Nocardia nova]OBA56176.1 mammalian cell entry protein [Nocardia sp. 852002-51101_SCH5132738]OBB36189.1 mammalian cell entry protein [Nocardia sp. 852002-51244_SCH5132740]OBF68861.1 mammalian cell entry protein [Mycobacterium sp. 852002-51759_SCH5129042]
MGGRGGGLSRPLTGFGVFAVVAVLVTTTIWNTLARTVSGPTNTYSATFGDVLGLQAGDDVRVAGVRVGKVVTIALDRNNHATVTFILQRGQTVFGETRALVRYQNLLGQRYVALEPGTKGNSAPLPDNGSIPLEQTEPSFDISGLLNGFQPLFDTLNTQQVNDLSNTLIQALQGDGVSLSSFITQAVALAGDWQRRDVILADVITQLSTVMQRLAARGGEFETLVTQTRALIGGLYDQGQALQTSTTRIAKTTSAMAGMFTQVEPKITAAQNATTNALAVLLANGAGLDRTAVDAQNIFADIGKFSSDGTYGNGFICSLDISLYGVLLPRGLISQIGGNSHSATCR